MHLDMGVRQSGKERLENLRRCDLDKCSTEINQRPQSCSWEEIWCTVCKTMQRMWFSTCGHNAVCNVCSVIFPVSPLASSAHIALFFPFSSALTAGASSDCLPPPPQPSHAAVCWQGLAFTKGGESLPTWGATSRCCGEFVSAYQKKIRAKNGPWTYSRACWQSLSQRIALHPRTQLRTLNAGIDNILLRPIQDHRERLKKIAADSDS